jgi:hypothetical protein
MGSTIAMVSSAAGAGAVDRLEATSVGGAGDSATGGGGSSGVVAGSPLADPKTGRGSATGAAGSRSTAAIGEFAGAAGSVDPLSIDPLLVTGSGAAGIVSFPAGSISSAFGRDGVSGKTRTVGSGAA